MSVHRDQQNLEGVLDAYEAELMATADEELLAESDEVELAAARGVLAMALAVADARQQTAAARRRRPVHRASSPVAVPAVRPRPEQMRATFSSDPTSALDDDDPGGLPD